MKRLWGFRRNRLKLSVTEPCHENWHAMPGTERERFCEACERVVHNLSAMTERDARKVLAASEGSRICARLCHDSQGDLVFRPEVRRLSGLAAFSLIGIGTQAAAMAQAPSCELRVQVKDPANGEVPRASVKVTGRGGATSVVGTTNAEGAYHSTLPNGRYEVAVEAPGFRSMAKTIDLHCLKSAEAVELDIALPIGTISMGGSVVEMDRVRSKK
jgi:Carboxypeptidase regulatory-like domain